jgi:hypothetical protein
MSSQKRIFSLGLGVLVILGLLISAPPAWSDWDPGDPYKMHYPQLPDLINGVDVMTTLDLADDFLCTSSGPITDIHIWGSFSDDGDYNPSFTLKIWSNMSASDPANTVPYSHPDQVLWEDNNTTNYTKILYAQLEPGAEDFYDPLGETFLLPDSQIWQFNFFYDPEDAFYQEEGNIYWLSVQALGSGDQYFGWKTAVLPVYEDTAVFFNYSEFWEPISIDSDRDLAFVITTPIPPSLLLLGSGLLGLGALGWRRKKQG